MKVSDLIEMLQQLPEDLPVILNGYEGGYWDVGSWEAIEINRHVNTENLDLWGPHDEAEDDDPDRVLCYLLKSRIEHP